MCVRVSASSANYVRRNLRAPDDAADRDGDLHRNWLVGGDSLTEQWIRYQENVVRTDRRRRLQPKNVTQVLPVQAMNRGSSSYSHVPGCSSGHSCRLGDRR